jgi:RNA polymerase sigma factor (sigma-70 family)
MVDPDLSHDRMWSSAQRARLVRLCTAVTGDADVAEDLAQQTLLEAWRRKDRLTDPVGMDAWLNAIARNMCRRWQRAAGGPEVPTSDEAVLDTAGPGHDLDAVLEHEDVVELLDRALALLPASTRDALVAHYVEELGHREIARRLGCSVEAVSMRVSRGRARLRYLLETTFADDAVAEAWLTRDDAGWRRTRLRCVECGRSSIVMRHNEAEVALRCVGCDPDGVMVHVPLDAPAFKRVIGDVRRPSAIQSRTARWSTAYWDLTGEHKTSSCVRCSRDVTHAPYSRSGTPSWSSRCGWFARCGSCGQEVSGSIAGVTLALPAAQAARKREPRLRALPVRDIVRDGRDAKVVGYGSPDGTTLVSAVFLRDSLRLVLVDSRLPG